MTQALCKPATVEGIAAARASVETYLGKLFDAINELQEAENFLDNVDTVQQHERGIDTWKVQREQLAAVESCAKACTCDEGAKLVIQEYNQLAAQAGEESGLTTVPLGRTTQWLWLGVGLVLILAWVWWRRKK